MITQIQAKHIIIIAHPIILNNLLKKLYFISLFLSHYIDTYYIYIYVVFLFFFFVGGVKVGYVGV